MAGGLFCVHTREVVVLKEELFLEARLRLDQEVQQWHLLVQQVRLCRDGEVLSGSTLVYRGVDNEPMSSRGATLEEAQEAAQSYVTGFGLAVNEEWVDVTRCGGPQQVRVTLSPARAG